MPPVLLAGPESTTAVFFVSGHVLAVSGRRSGFFGELQTEVAACLRELEAVL
jgi:hypothetical protein